MNTKFTPGPWEMSETTKKGKRWFTGKGWQKFGMVYTDTGGADEVGEANARLIKESPMLFQALVNIKKNRLCKLEVDAHLGQEIWEVLDRVVGEQNADR